MNIRDQVTQFHLMIGSPVLDTPREPPPDRARLRAALVAEEAFELLADGKKRKPAGWQPPDIAALLRAQGWQP